MVTYGDVVVSRDALQSVWYRNVFALVCLYELQQDCTIFSQAPALIHNLQKEMNGEELGGMHLHYRSSLAISGHRDCGFDFGNQISRRINCQSKSAIDRSPPLEFLIHWLM